MARRLRSLAVALLVAVLGLSAAPALAADPPSDTVTSATIVRSASPVFPVHDGYVDSVAFDVAFTTSSGGVIPLTGALTIRTAGGALVTTRPIVDSSAKRFVWSGKLSGGKIAPGVYTVSASVDDGTATTTASTAVRVSDQKLIERHVDVTISAKAALVGCQTQSPSSICGVWNKGAKTKRGEDLYGGLHLVGALWLIEQVRIPSAVRASKTVPKARVTTIDTPAAYSTVNANRITVSLCTSTGCEPDGEHGGVVLSKGDTTKIVRIDSIDESHLAWMVELGEGSRIDIHAYTVRFFYTTLG